METTKDLIKIFEGVEASAVLLIAKLEEIGVYTLTKNELTSTYFGSVQPFVDVWISDDDLERAKPLIDEFITNEQKEVIQ